ncbi:MAG: MOSC domain-containing protein [Acidovorax sp.]|nr:MOSC domain-containing protein [Acidovorax sp.]
MGERSILSAIGKTPVTGPVALGPLGLAGDEQADLSVHGGLAKAVYAYPAVHYAFWQAQRRERGVSLFDEALPPGFLGENLTIDGPLEGDVFVGDEWHFPDCLLRVTAPREPCFKFAAVMGFAQAEAIFLHHKVSFRLTFAIFPMGNALLSLHNESRWLRSSHLN